MATLEKIRSKSVLLLIVIGVALLAFIIGDFFTSGRTLFGSGTTIAKVGDQKIDIQEFSRRYEEANQQYQQQNVKMDPAMLQQYVLQQMIQERLLNQELDELGIVVTDDELTQNMLGASAHPMMVQMAQQMGFQSPDQLYDVAFNPGKYGVPADQAQQIQAMWLRQEQQMEQALKQQKLQSMLLGAIVANDLDAKALYDENASTSHIVYARKAFSDVPDGEENQPTAADIRDLYNKEKNNYRIDEENRRVNYIAVNIVPSQTDINEGRTLVDTTVARLRERPELEAVNGDSNFGIDRRSTTASAISNPKLREYVTSHSAGDADVLSFINDEYTIVKLLGSKTAVDSVNVDVVAYQGTAAGRDSVLNALNSGTAFEKVLAMPGVAGGQADVWQSLASAPDNDVKTRLLNAGKDYFIADTMGTDARIIRVNTRRAPVAVYDYATVSYKIYPSDATIAKLNSDLENFVAGIANADSLTISKAVNAGYSLQQAVVSANSAQLGNMPYTRNAVKWAMDAKKGQVSPVLEDSQSDKLMVVALTDINAPGYLPASDVDINMMLAERARNSKKAAKLISDYQGKANDVAGYAALMNVPVDSATVTFGQMFIPGVGAGEDVLLGQVPVSENNQVVGPVEGNNGVYVYQVYEVDNESRPYNYDESAARYAQQFGSQAVLGNVIGILIENNPVENNTLKFYTE